VLIDKVGADKLKGVDFTADTPPEAIADELNKAFVDAIPTCDIDLSGTTDTTDKDASDEGSSDSSDDTTDTSIDPAELDSFKDMLATQYEQTLGLSKEKATCLAGVMAEAVQSGKLSEQDSFNEFFQYLDGCNISISELGGAGN
jgi:hypothetical protein